MIPQLKRPRTATALVSIAVAVSLCPQSRFTAPKLFFIGGGDLLTEEQQLEEERVDESQFRRYLMDTFKDGYIDELVNEVDYDAAAALADSSEPASPLGDGPINEISPPPSLQPYTLEDALLESEMFECTFAIIVYDPPSDKFVALYSRDHKWKNRNRKLWKSLEQFVHMLRKEFPERFTPSSPEFVFAMASGDYPQVKTYKLPHDGVAPVLMFGSSFRDPTVYSNMMAMPMPESHHLECFEEWAVKGSLCKKLKAKPEGALEFGEENGLEWDGLIPQVVWRGTDFGFLPILQPRPSLVHGDYRKLVRSPDPKQKGNRRTLRRSETNRRIDAIRALNESYETLLPRWKGVALTAEAELEASGKEGALPWINVKLSNYINNKLSTYLGVGKLPTVGSLKYSEWESVGIATGKYMSHTDLAKYKYHIDLGGGGGTTWSGTIEKLAMPGLLFHHVTPTKDYIHDRLVPWKHYIPVSPDLKDLKKKYDWAESHPAQAKRIADSGTEFMRRLGTEEEFGRMYREDFVEPMRRVIEAYRPVSSVHNGSSLTSWQEVLKSMGDDNRVIPVMDCRYNSCDLVGGNDLSKSAKGEEISRGGRTYILKKEPQRLIYN